MAEASGWNPFLLDTKRLPPLISWGWVSATAVTPVTLTSPILAVKRINARNGRQRLKAPPTLLSSTHLQDGLGLLASLLVSFLPFSERLIPLCLVPFLPGCASPFTCFISPKHDNRNLPWLPRCLLTPWTWSSRVFVLALPTRLAACLTALLQTLCKPRRTISRCTALCFCSGDCSARNAFLP